MPFFYLACVCVYPITTNNLQILTQPKIIEMDGKRKKIGKLSDAYFKRKWNSCEIYKTNFRLNLNSWLWTEMKCTNIESVIVAAKVYHKWMCVATQRLGEHHIKCN